MFGQLPLLYDMSTKLHRQNVPQIEIYGAETQLINVKQNAHLFTVTLTQHQESIWSRNNNSSQYLNKFILLYTSSQIRHIPELHKITGSSWHKKSSENLSGPMESGNTRRPVLVLESGVFANVIRNDIFQMADPTSNPTSHWFPKIATRVHPRSSGWRHRWQNYMRIVLMMTDTISTCCNSFNTYSHFPQCLLDYCRVIFN